MAKWIWLASECGLNLIRLAIGTTFFRQIRQSMNYVLS